MSAFRAVPLVQSSWCIILWCMLSAAAFNQVQPGAKSPVPLVGGMPKSMEDLITTLQRTQGLLLQMTIRVGQLEARQNLLLKGRDGRDGKDGKEGRSGRDGRDGENGKQGPAGVNGAPGQAGRDGFNGKDGKPGAKGDQGDTGPMGPQGPKGDRSGGVKYVRWGKSTCPTNATLVYSGRMGGERFTSKGGGTNYVCLPHNPKYGKFNGKINRQSASIYGVEYEVKSYNPFTNKNLHDRDASCAVCYVSTRSVNLMVPATNECPAGWTRDYYGYIMTSSRNHHPGEFICVDGGAEGLPNSAANKNGALLYTVEGRCGSLPCDKYISGRELTCAVCSK